MGLSRIEAVVGGLNTDKETVLANVHASIHRGLPQVRPYDPNTSVAAIVCGGPSLPETVDELRDVVFAGAKVIAVNGAHEWCIRQNFRPSMGVVLDARAHNAAFVATPVPECQYMIASQCAPEVFDMVEGRSAWIFHAMSFEADETAILDSYYRKQYHPVTGGSTVAIRTISMLRMLGFQRMHLFGFDSCWLDGQHHGFTQASNDGDKQMRVTVEVGETREVFQCAPWHLKQLQDFELLVKERGHLFELSVHGRGLIAHAIKTGAAIVETVELSGLSGDPTLWTAPPIMRVTGDEEIITNVG